MTRKSSSLGPVPAPNAPFNDMVAVGEFADLVHAVYSACLNKWTNPVSIGSARASDIVASIDKIESAMPQFRAAAESILGGK